MDLTQLLPTDWKKILSDAITSEKFQTLENFLKAEWQQHTIFPPKEDIFSAFHLTPFDKVKVVILGQDPYHDHNQAHGLSFSVRPGVKIPPSLRNIFKELQSDLGTAPPDNGYLNDWAKQGILMLNTILTVRAHQANSHSKKGWEAFTDAVIEAVSSKPEPVVFVLWGASAQSKQELIDSDKNEIITSVHPSPLSARRGFLGSRPFSKINELLEKNQLEPINWQLDHSMLF